MEKFLPMNIISKDDNTGTYRVECPFCKRVFVFTVIDGCGGEKCPLCGAAHIYITSKVQDAWQVVTNNKEEALT